MPPPSANHTKNRPYINRFSCVCCRTRCYIYACTLPIHNIIIIMVVAANYYNIDCVRTHRDIDGVIIIRRTGFSGLSVPCPALGPPPCRHPRRNTILYTIFDGLNAKIFSPVFGGPKSIEWRTRELGKSTRSRILWQAYNAMYKVGTYWVSYWLESHEYSLNYSKISAFIIARLFLK